MATGPEHYRQAERHLERAYEVDTGTAGEQYFLAAAQVHATLALAAATAIQPSLYETGHGEVDEWRQAVMPKTKPAPEPEQYGPDTPCTCPPGTDHKHDLPYGCCASGCDCRYFPMLADDEPDAYAGHRGNCRSCNAPIIWAQTTSGKSMPIDVEPDPGGNVELEPRNGRAPIAHVHIGMTGGHKSHFATCPNADQHRRRA